MQQDSADIRTFTLDEAQALIPRLRRLLSKVGGERDALMAMQPEIQKARDQSKIGGGSRIGPAYFRRLFAFTQAVHDIEGLGVIVKDFQKGLVDFPHEREGRIVFLCWKPDENEIGWWHEVDTGFSGRLPLVTETE
ncbi:MAG: DUF2203 domain-containing protein [Blastocatellia bacterium]